MNLLKFYILYVGPGMGAGTFAVVIGILSTFILSLFVFLWYPIKRFIQFCKQKFKQK
jgi:flagellar biogenesis protein FliO